MDKVLVEIFCYVSTYSACQASFDRSTCWILYKEEKTPIVHVFIPSKVFKGWLLQENNCEEELMPSIDRWQKASPFMEVYNIFRYYLNRENDVEEYIL